MQPLEHDPLILLADVARLMRTRADQRARALGMTRAQWAILWRVKRYPGLSQSELAGMSEVEPITIVRLIDRLEARGVVERRADPSDRRIRRLYLLPAADAILVALSSHWEEMKAEMTVGLDETAYAALIDGLLKVKANLLVRHDIAVEPAPAE